MSNNAAAAASGTNRGLPIFGVRGTDGSDGGDGRCIRGDPTRMLFAPGSSFTGAWTDNTAYYKKDPETGVLRLNRVCWLDVKGKIRDVPVGEWEVLAKIRIRTGLNVKASWQIGIEPFGRERDSFNDGDHAVVVNEENRKVFRTLTRWSSTHQEGHAKAITDASNGQWIMLSFGRIRATRDNSTVAFYAGGKGNWVSGVDFGGLELRSVGLSHEKLCLLKKGGALQSLPMVLTDKIIEYVHTYPPKKENKEKGR